LKYRLKKILKIFFKTEEKLGAFGFLKQNLADVPCFSGSAFASAPPKSGTKPFK
jgi:hypothetical protein